MAGMGAASFDNVLVVMDHQICNKIKQLFTPPIYDNLSFTQKPYTVTVKRQMKSHKMRHSYRVCTVHQDKKQPSGT